MDINIPTFPAVYRWRPACWLRVTGDDAATFLQGQFTNDLRSLPKARSVYGLWLTLKGKVLADSFVLSGDEAGGFWLGSYHASSGIIRERLESHVIADDVVIEDVTESWAGISVMGENVVALGEGARSGPDGLIFRGRRSRAPNVEVAYPIAAGAPKWIATLAARVMEAEEITQLRIEAAIPAIPQDIGPADLPNEAGLEADAISYTKGCYLGQEVMARLKSMGKVRRRLLRVQGNGENIPALPAAIFVGTRQVGELRSAVRDGAGGWIGLAMISLLQVSPTSELAFAASGPATFRLSESP